MTKSRNLRNNTARSDAVSSGSTYYCTGIPCIQGHLADRLTSNGACTACTSMRKSEADKKFYLKYAEELKAYQKQYRQENGKALSAKDKEKWFRNHKRNLEQLRIRSKKHGEKKKLNRQFDAFMCRIQQEEAQSC